MGKSTATATLRRLGVPVIDADELARRVVEPGRPAYKKIAKKFGPAVLQPDGTLDRAALGELVFRDRSARGFVNSATHTQILLELLSDLAQLFGDGHGSELHSARLPCAIPRATRGASECRSTSTLRLDPTAVAVLDAPLLFESKLNLLCGVTLCVVCGEASQLERLVARDGLTAEQAAQRIAAQLPAVVKAARSDHTVDNSGGREASAAQLEALLQPLQRSHPRRERVAWAWARLPCASNGGISAMLWVALAVIRLFAAVRGRRGSAL